MPPRQVTARTGPGRSPVRWCTTPGGAPPDGSGSGGREPGPGDRPGPGGPVRRGAGSARSGAAGGRTAARTRARLGTEAGGVEPRGEECVRGHVPERVSGPGGGQPPPAAAERTPRRPPSPPRTPPTTCTFPRAPTRAPARPGGRKAWLDFMAPQCGRHAFAGIRPRHPVAGPGREAPARPAGPGTRARRVGASRAGTTRRRSRAATPPWLALPIGPDRGACPKLPPDRRGPARALAAVSPRAGTTGAAPAPAHPPARPTDRQTGRPWSDPDRAVPAGSRRATYRTGRPGLIRQDPEETARDGRDTPLTPAGEPA